MRDVYRVLFALYICIEVTLLGMIMRDVKGHGCIMTEKNMRLYMNRYFFALTAMHLNAVRSKTCFPCPLRR